MLHRLQCRFLGVKFVKYDEDYVTTSESARKKDLDETEQYFLDEPTAPENVFVLPFSQQKKSPPITFLCFIAPLGH